LPTLGPVLDRLRAEVLDGRGFALLRGMPVEDRPIAESATAYWGVGTQNAQGHHPGLPPHDGGLARVQRGQQSRDSRIGLRLPRIK
jgi:hypothetical protein